MSSDQNHQSADRSTTTREPDFGLSLTELGSLLVAIGSYGTEAQVCYDAGAYLASCIMLAATIEGYLVILTSAFPKEAQEALRQLQKANQIDKRLRLSSLLNWDLGELLKVAKQANWLPSEIAAHPLLDPDDVSNPLSPDRIRELRNLIHPGRLVKTRGGIKITKQELDILHETYIAVLLHLAKRAESLDFSSRHLQRSS
jgi:hypothetical protein